MRKLVALFLGLVLAPSAVAAGAAATQTLSMNVSAHRVLYKHHTLLSGRLMNGLVAGRTVVITARPYGSSAPHRLATVTTNVNGDFTYGVRPSIQTTYQAHAGTVASPQVTIGVAPAISVLVLSNGRIRTQVEAGRSFGGRMVELQTPTAGGTWQTVARKKLSSASIAVISPGMPTSTMRVAMSVNQAGAGFLGAASHPFLYHTTTLTMTPATSRVVYGHSVTLDGHLVNGTGGQHVTILGRPYGRSSAVKIATVSTGPGGRFSLSVKPTIQTTYQARLGTAQASTPTTVGVEPAITVHVGTRVVTAHVKATPTFRGRMVELQRHIGAHLWQTVARRPLNAGSKATFSMTLPHLTILRVAMSVNQAGAGYLGTVTHPFLYRAL